MGVRSRANEYYSDGSMALKREAFYGEESIRLKRRNSGRRAAKQQRILKGQRARLAVLGIAGGALIVILSAVSLKGLDQNSLLSAEISNLENQVESLTVYNDARE